MDLLPPMATGDQAAAYGQKAGSAVAELPNRYSIRERDGKRELVCRESPSIAVQVERGLSIPGPAARKSPPGSIFLDGTAQEAPFLDVEKHVYNLDHHQGCVRGFTLATCEQAMVVVRKGLDLQGRDWMIYANEPDLDTVLAIWVLLNHLHITGSDSEVRSKVMPLVRLQGVIDAHGLEMQDLCGFPDKYRESVYAELERLRAREVELKKESKWQGVDFLDYTAEVLRTIDALVYSSRHFEGTLEVEELARAELGDRSLAIVCRSDAGIYEVEQYLRRYHGKRLGIIVLQKDPRTYTLRQVDAFLPGTLQDVYERLNQIDPAAGATRSGNRWGGSTEIGGSPRTAGSELTPQQIADACAAAFSKAPPSQRLGNIVAAVLGSAIVVLGPALAVYLISMSFEPVMSLQDKILHRAGIFTGLFCFLSGILLMLAARPYPKLYGLCLPSGRDWLFLLPTALAGALLTGSWAAATVVPGASAIQGHTLSRFTIALALPAAAEVLFRGFAHGVMARGFRIQQPDGAWFASWPAMLSALLYTFWTSVPFLPLYSIGFPLSAAGSLLFGLSAAIARERSESLVPPLLFQWLSLAMLLLVHGS